MTIRIQVCGPPKSGKRQFLRLALKLYPELATQMFITINSSNLEKFKELTDEGYINVLIQRRQELRVNNAGEYKEDFLLSTIPITQFDYTINNNTTPEAMEEAVRFIIKQERSKQWGVYYG